MLYEDLRIEIAGLTDKPIPAFDELSAEYRRQYFLRRSTLTLSEFADALTKLDRMPDFAHTRNQFNPEGAKAWRKSVRFLSKFKPVLEKVRNDVGGHFGLEAARYAIESLPPSTIGKVEVIDRKRVKLHYAGEIAVGPYTRNVPGKTDAEKNRYLFKRVQLGYYRAFRAMIVIVFFYLWDRFA